MELQFPWFGGFGGCKPQSIKLPCSCGLQLELEFVLYLPLFCSRAPPQASSPAPCSRSVSAPRSESMTDTLLTSCGVTLTPVTLWQDNIKVVFAKFTLFLKRKFHVQVIPEDDSKYSPVNSWCSNSRQTHPDCSYLINNKTTKMQIEAFFLKCLFSLTYSAVTPTVLT